MTQNKKKPSVQSRPWVEKARRVPVLGRLFHNLSLKLLALLFAIIIWSVVMSQTNPPRSKLVYDVPIEITGMQSLVSRSLALKSIPEEMEGTVDVMLEVPLNDLGNANADNVTATVDLSRITTTGEYTLNLNLSSRYGSAVSATQESFTVEVESREESAVPVRVNYIGALDESLHSGTVSVKPAEVTISGPVTEVNRVSYAQVDVDLGELSDSFSQSLVFTLFDEDGKAIDFDGFTIPGGNSVSVSLPVYPVKEVPISFESSVSGELPEGYELLSVTPYPATVRVAADRSVLDSLTSIPVSAFRVDDLREDAVITVNLRQLTDVKWMELSQVELALQVAEQTESRTFANVPVQARNLAEGYAVDTFDARVDVTITGPRSQMEALTRGQISAYLDLASYGPGQFVDNVQVEVEGLTEYSCTLDLDRITFVISQ